MLYKDREVRKKSWKSWNWDNRLQNHDRLVFFKNIFNRAQQWRFADKNIFSYRQLVSSAKALVGTFYKEKLFVDAISEWILSISMSKLNNYF